MSVSAHFTVTLNTHLAVIKLQGLSVPVTVTVTDRRGMIIETLAS